MQKRYGNESNFILNGDKSVEAVKAWTKKIFSGTEAQDFRIPEEVYEWFLEVVFEVYEKAESDLIRRMIMVKIIHTREVVRAGVDITRGEKNFKWNDFQVRTVCILHDIGRFEQALLGSYSDVKTNFDHALAGAEMIKKRDFGEFTVLGIDKNSVVESVRYHSAYSYPGEDMYAKLIRDADKLALLRCMPEILAVKVEEYPSKGVTEAALRAYKAGTMVRNEDINTKADLFLAWLGWQSDFNFSQTAKYLDKEGIKRWMVEELALLGVEI
ncbi:MAG: metal-dependent phosphoesterase [uncultured bacterium]|nr:MAG: metal-dependent phosphoesterase [uncultured bacterium]